MIKQTTFQKYVHIVEHVLRKHKNAYTAWQLHNDDYSTIRIKMPKESTQLVIELATKLEPLDRYYKTTVVWDCYESILSIYILDDVTAPIAAKASATAKLERVHAHQIEYIVLMREAIDAVKGVL